MMPVQYKLPQIALTAGREVSASDTSMKQLPLQSDDGKQLYLVRSKYRVAGTLTIAAAISVVRLARLFSLFRIKLEGLGFSLWDLDGKGTVVQAMVDRLGRPLPNRDEVDTTLASTRINSQDAFAGLTTDNAGGSIAFDVTFMIDWAKRFSRDSDDYIWPAAVARCFEHELTVGPLSGISESTTHTTGLTATLDITHELEPREGLQFPKIVSVSQQALSGEEPTDITAFDGQFRSLVLNSNVADYFANNVIDEIQVSVGNLDLVPKKTDVRVMYDTYNDEGQGFELQDHTVPAAAAARRNQYLPILAPTFFRPQRSTEQLDARAPVKFVISNPANFKLIRSVEHYWNDALLDHVISKTGLDPAQLTVKPNTASKKPAAEGSKLALRQLPFKVVGQNIDFTKRG